MKNPKILIFDPHLSIYKNYLESIIAENTNCKTITCRSKDDIKSLTDKDFILIFTFFENENQVNGHTFKQEFFKEFDTIPKVGIIKSCLDCKRCPSVKKELCNFITVPFDEQDILNKLDKFIDSKDDSKIIPIQSFLKSLYSCLHYLSWEIFQLMFYRSGWLSQGPGNNNNNFPTAYRRVQV